MNNRPTHKTHLCSTYFLCFFYFFFCNLLCYIYIGLCNTLSQIWKQFSLKNTKFMSLRLCVQFLFHRALALRHSYSHTRTQRTLCTQNNLVCVAYLPFFTIKFRQHLIQNNCYSQSNNWTFSNELTVINMFRCLFK